MQIIYLTFKPCCTRDITQPFLVKLPVFQSAPEPPLLDIVHANELGCQLVASRLDAFLVEQKILPGRQ